MTRAKKTAKTQSGAPESPTELTPKLKERLKSFRALGMRWWNEEGDGRYRGVEETEWGRVGNKVDSGSLEWNSIDHYSQRHKVVRAVGWHLGHPTNDLAEIERWEELTRLALKVLRRNLPGCHDYIAAIQEARVLVGDPKPLIADVVFNATLAVPPDFNIHEVGKYRLQLVREDGKEPIVADQVQVEDVNYEDSR